MNKDKIYINIEHIKPNSIKAELNPPKDIRTLETDLNKWLTMRNSKPDGKSIVHTYSHGLHYVNNPTTFYWGITLNDFIFDTVVGKWVLDLEAVKGKTLESIASNLLSIVNLSIDSLFNNVILRDFSKSEVDSFYMQTHEASEYIKNTATPAPFIEQVAKIRDMTVPELVTKIKQKEAKFKAVCAVLFGNKQKLEDNIAKIITENSQTGQGLLTGCELFNDALITFKKALKAGGFETNGL